MLKHFYMLPRQQFLIPKEQNRSIHKDSQNDTYNHSIYCHTVAV